MSKKSAKSGTRWTVTELQQLKDLAAKNTPTRIIGNKLERTEEAIRAKAKSEGISLKPTNQSPYGKNK